MDGITSVKTAAYIPSSADARAEVDVKGNKDAAGTAMNADRSVAEKDAKADKSGNLQGSNKSNKSMLNPERLNNRTLRLDIDKDLNIVVAKIVDKKSGEVVKQIPPEETVKLMKFYKENPGALVSRQA